MDNNYNLKSKRKLKLKLKIRYTKEKFISFLRSNKVSIIILFVYFLVGLAVVLIKNYKHELTEDFFLIFTVSYLACAMIFYAYLSLIIDWMTEKREVCKKMACLPLSSDEISANNIKSADDYIEFLNKYLSGEKMPGYLEKAISEDIKSRFRTEGNLWNDNWYFSTLPSKYCWRNKKTQTKEEQK